MSTRLSKFRALPRPEQRILLAAMLLLPLFGLALRVLGLRRLQAWLNRPVVVARSDRLSEDVARVGALVNIAGAHAPFHSTCLTRSLLLIWLLRRHGLPSELRIGVRLVTGKLEAHAWVECGGKPINDTQDVSERFAAFDGPLSPTSFPSL